MNSYDAESLARNDGKQGRPAFIAHQGRVVDVSGSGLWKGGRHMNRHAAGRDLSADIGAAPHGPEVLDRYPQVGVLEPEAGAQSPAPKSLERLLERFPALRRHPHPMVVHFPIVFAITPLLFFLLSRIANRETFETTAFHCLGAGLLFCVPAILTGYFTWWLNYGAKPLKPVLIKIRFSGLLMAVYLAAFLVRLLFPGDVRALSGWGAVYLVLLGALVPVVSVIGWNGAKLTFPVEK